MNGLLIGRFQPFHIGHLAAVKFALEKVEKLWIGIGSSNRSNEKRNPFTADERKEMILASLDPDIKRRVEIYYVPDIGDHERWTYHVDSIVPKYDVVFSNDDFTISLYQRRGMKVIQVPLYQREMVSGTNIREMILADKDWASLVPQGTRDVLVKIGARERLLMIP
ncbi:MAG TPA: nicotinamide-nucleotide adenylyltransferase [Candidatus Nitrosotalea sp.]|nr:nicotinamide-nucleotide adenylyltransferase [Candidatus Nitrosotalea sp.]